MDSHGIPLAKESLVAQEATNDEFPRKSGSVRPFPAAYRSASPNIIVSAKVTACFVVSKIMALIFAQ
jgi:hypothetical protein